MCVLARLPFSYLEEMLKKERFASGTDLGLRNKLVSEIGPDFGNSF